IDQLVNAGMLHRDDAAVLGVGARWRFATHHPRIVFRRNVAGRIAERQRDNWAGAQIAGDQIAAPARLVLIVRDGDETQIGEAIRRRRLAELREITLTVSVIELARAVAGAERRHDVAALAEHARLRR